MVYLTEQDPAPASCSQSLECRSKSVTSISKHLKKTNTYFTLRTAGNSDLGGDIAGRYTHTEHCPTNSYNRYVHIYSEQSAER